MITPYNVNGDNLSVSDSVDFFKKNIGDLKGHRVNVFSEDKDEFLHDFFVKYTEELLKESLTKDYLIINELRLVEELDELINRLFERLHELYGLYYPEAAYQVNSPESFYDVLKKGFKRKKVSKRLKVSEKSFGMDIKGQELKVLKNGINHFVEMFDLRKEVKKNVKSLSKRLLPNTSKVCGDLLAAKLLSEAGSLKNLAMMPSSTIQVLGAEKALFRHLTTGSKSPKHGVILQHPFLQKVNYKNRGKMARVLAGKISLAVKVDYFNPNNKKEGKKLYKKVEKEFKSLR